MTIDERLEALTQSVELLSQMHQDNERQHAESEKRHAENQKRNDENDRRFLDMFERLTRIAESHETRISGLERHNDIN